LDQLPKNILILLIVAALAAGAGYYFAPDKIKIQEKVVEKVVEVEKETNLKEKEVIEKYDPKTGKLVERIIRDKEKNSKKSEEKKETDKDKTVEKIKEQKHYAVKFGAVAPLTKLENPSYRVGGELRLPIFNSWIGSEIDIKKNPDLGVYLRMEF